MGGVEKGLQPLRGRPMVAHVIERLSTQVAEIVINANKNGHAYAHTGYHVVPDVIGHFAGPLAGLHAGMGAVHHKLLLIVPCDSPFLPLHLCFRLRSSLGKNEIAVAKVGNQVHWVFALLRRSLSSDLENYLKSGGHRISDWYSNLRVIEVGFDDEADAFRNINTPEELGRARARSGNW